MSDLAEIERVVANLLVATAPAERRRILRAVVRDLRRSQASRIAAQRNPDGSAFAPRRSKPDGRLRRKGRVRQAAMFRKLRLAKSLRMGATPDEAWLGFAGRAAMIARVHQEGRSDRPSPTQRPVTYARRVLLGTTDAERRQILDLVLDQITMN